VARKASRPAQRWTTFTNGGRGQGSLRKIHAAVKSCVHASRTATVASHAFRCSVSEKKRRKNPAG
jgi:hypothetical protein